MKAADCHVQTKQNIQEEKKKLNEALNAPPVGEICLFIQNRISAAVNRGDYRVFLFKSAAINSWENDKKLLKQNGFQLIEDNTGTWICWYHPLYFLLVKNSFRLLLVFIIIVIYLTLLLGGHI